MNYYSKKVNDLTPYIPGEQPKEGEYIKLNTNENPYPPSKNVISAIKNYDFDKLRLYPDPESIDLRRICAKYLNLNIENIFVGNGSDEVLATAFQTFFMDIYRWSNDLCLISNSTYSLGKCKLLYQNHMYYCTRQMLCLHLPSYFKNY